MPLEFEVHDAESGGFGYTEPRYAGLLERLNDILDGHETGRMSDAKYLAALQELLAQAPDFLDAHTQIAFHWHRQGKPKKALDAALLGLGIANRQIPQGFAGRIEWLDIDNRAYLRTMHVAVLSYMRLRRHRDAAALIEQMLLRNPNDNQGVRYLLGPELLRAHLLGTVAQHDRAVAVLAAHADTYAPYWYELALAHMQCKRWVAAATALRRGFAANPYIAEILGGNPAPPAHAIWHADDSALPEAASEYVAAYGGLWHAHTTHLPFVRWLFHHSQVMIERAAIVACQEALFREIDPDERAALLARLDKLTEAIDDTLSAAIVVRTAPMDTFAPWPWDILVPRPMFE